MKRLQPKLNYSAEHVTKAAMWLVKNREIVQSLTIGEAYDMIRQGNPFMEKLAKSSFAKCAQTLEIEFKKPPRKTYTRTNNSSKLKKQIALLAQAIIHLHYSTQQAIGGVINLPNDLIEDLKRITNHDQE